MSRYFEIIGKEWGDANTIEYLVVGYTQATRGLFKDKAELMDIFEGIASDFFSTAPGIDEPRTTEEWERILKEKK